MYASEFGLEWSSLTREEAIVRAYALGVATSLGEEHPAELDRILKQMTTAYGQSIVELSFEEGKTLAKSYESTGSEEAWTALVEDRGPEAVGSHPKEIEGLPKRVTQMEMLEAGGDEFKRLRLPEFLFRS